MKLNSFQKISFIIYILTLITTLIFIPFKSFNEYFVEYDFIWSNKSNIDFFRYSISIVIITIIFFLLIKFYQGYNNIKNEDYNKKIQTEKRVFILYLTIIIIVLLILLTSNFLNTNKINEINTQKEKIEKRLSDYDLKKKNRMDFYNVMDYTFNLRKFNGSVPKFWERTNEIIKNKENKIISEILTSTNYFSDKKSFEKFIIENNYNKFDIETENKYFDLSQKTGLQKTEIKKYKNKVYTSNEIIRTMVFISLILTLILYILRPTFIFILTIFKEKK
jgi:hypothetical protein